MGFRETMNRIFSTRTETGEEHPVKELQTRYYKTTKDKAMRTIEQVLTQQGLTIKRSEDDGVKLLRKRNQEKNCC